MKLEVSAPTDPQPSWVFDMAVLPSCNLLIADHGNDSLKVVDVQTGRLLSHLHLPGRPYNLCLLPGDRAAVSLLRERVIQIVDISSDQLKLLESVKVAVKCIGLAYLNNKFIVGLPPSLPFILSDQQCVAYLNTEETLLKSVTKDNMENQLFKDPSHICVTTDIDGLSIYVSDRGTHTITRLSEKLEVLQTFRFPTMDGPYDLTAAGGGQLLVRGCYGGFTTLWVLNTGTGEFRELLGYKWEVWYTACVEFCPRLGRVYTNIGKHGENSYIRVYGI